MPDGTDTTTDTSDSTTSDTTTTTTKTADPELGAMLVEKLGLREEIAMDPDVQNVFINDSTPDKSVFRNAFTNALDGFQNTINSSYMNFGGLTGDGNPFESYSNNLAAFQSIAAFDSQFGAMLDLGASMSPFSSAISEMNMGANSQFAAEHMNIMNMMMQQQMLIAQMQASNLGNVRAF